MTLILLTGVGLSGVALWAAGAPLAVAGPVMLQGFGSAAAFAITGALMVRRDG